MFSYCSWGGVDIVMEKGEAEADWNMRAFSDRRPRERKSCGTGKTETTKTHDRIGVPSDRKPEEVQHQEQKES